MDFHDWHSSSNIAINPSGNRYFLPIEFSKEFGRFGVNPEIGYAVYTRLASEWDYGIAISYEFEKEKEALFEVHGRSQVGVADQEWLYNVGTRYGLVQNVGLLFTDGRTFEAFKDESASWNVYLGFQIRI